MAKIDKLARRLGKLAKESDARQLDRIESRSRAMGDLNVRLDRFHAQTENWIEHEITPRLEALAAILPPGNPPRFGTKAHAAFLETAPSEEFPASAELVIQFAHDPDVERAQVTTRTRIIPVLMQYDKEGTIEVDLDEAGTAKLIEFLEDRICRFAADYLRIREPDSGYQRDQLVTDPVCGMTLHRWESAASVQQGRLTHYFCSDECRERFEAEPEGYLS